MDDEFVDTGTIGPVVLKRRDLETLENILASSVVGGFKPGLKWLVEDGARRVGADSLADLLKKPLPRVWESLRVDCHVHGDTVGSSLLWMSVRVYRSFGDFNVRTKDETIFRGKMQQLGEFFRMRCPWYRWLRRFSALGMAQIVASLFGAAALYGFGRSSSALLLAALGLLVGLVSWLVESNRIFPYMRITAVQDNDGPSGWEIAQFTLNAGLLIATAALAVVTFISLASGKL
jgi:hypothetical protein